MQCISAAQGRSSPHVECKRAWHRDVGCHGVPVIDGCQGLDRACKGLGMGKDMQSGILFSTYSTLVSVTLTQKVKGSSRLQQLVDWCGGPLFEGCLLFDECHKAKNFTGKEETSSKVSQAVIELQRALPHARVVYCSATGASDLSNMACERPATTNITKLGQGTAAAAAATAPTRGQGCPYVFLKDINPAGCPHRPVRGHPPFGPDGHVPS